MSVAVVLELQAQPDKLEELKATMKSLLPDTRAYDGCKGVTVHQDQDDPTRILVLETWISRPQYKKYFAWRTETGALAAVVALSAAPPSVRYFDDVDA